MTFTKQLYSATAIGAVLAAMALPASAQSDASDGITASDLGVDKRIEDQSAANETGMDSETSGDDATMTAEGENATGNPASDGVNTLTAESEFTDEKLDAFVTTALEIQDVRNDYAQQVSEAESEAAAELLVEQARVEMMNVVENAENITAEEYMAIGTAAQTDPVLANRLTAMFEAEMDDDGAGEEDQS